MPTVSQLRNKLRLKGLPISGSKSEFIKRLNESASVKGKKKIPVNLNSFNSLSIFYISLYFQNQNSKMAKEWVKSRGLTHQDAMYIYKKIKK